jgi:hypothetical protein
VLPKCDFEKALGNTFTFRSTILNITLIIVTLACYVVSDCDKVALNCSQPEEKTMKKKWEEMIEAVVSEVRKIYSRTNGKKERFMPEKRTIKKAQKAKRAEKAPSTQASEFVPIGLSKARRSGVKLAPATGKKIVKKKASPKKSHSANKRLQGESKSVVSHKALSQHGKKVARKKAA